MGAVKWARLLRVAGLSGRKGYGIVDQPGALQSLSLGLTPCRLAAGLHATVPLHRAHQGGSRTRLVSRAGPTTLGILLLAAGLASALLHPSNPTFAEEPPAPNERPLIRLAEIQEHNREAGTFWVYRGDRVYDITDWVPNHPGGEVILRAVGGSIEPYWNIFTIHQNRDVYDILEQYFIGNNDPRDLVDGKAPARLVDDPFKSDPERDSSLMVRSSRPCNAETPASELGTFITPAEKFYVRNHLWVPDVGDAEDHRLTIELIDGEEVTYSVADLRKNFREYNITATLQCSGNRRAHMTAGSRPTNGLQWQIGAISTATWTGVRLRDVLAHAGVDLNEPDEDIKHAQFVGAEAYGASISFDKAIDRHGDVMLVYAMNGQALPRDHGYPLRVLVPGHVAARSVKWLNKVILSGDESTSQWQKRDYKCFGPNVASHNVNWDDAPAIQETPVQSAITGVRQVKGDRLRDSDLARVYGLEEESVVLEGYAFAGGGREIIRVDVSPDNGKTWWQAQLLPHDKDVHDDNQKAWAWKQWRLAVPTHALHEHFCVKAVDESYNSQPEQFDAFYNFRGNLANGWHRVPVSSRSKD